MSEFLWERKGERERERERERESGGQPVQSKSSRSRLRSFMISIRLRTLVINKIWSPVLSRTLAVGALKMTSLSEAPTWLLCNLAILEGGVVLVVWQTKTSAPGCAWIP